MEEDEKKEDLEYRDKVVREILNTERTYVDQLEIATKDYLIPLRSENILESEEITKIFSVIELIRDVNKTLLKDLEERIENHWDTRPTIGDIFLTLGHFLKMYSEYCANFSDATDALIAARTNRAFRKFEDTHKLALNSIESYLILPVQRIPRYYLLLEDFLLHTDTSHRDYNDLVKAVQMIKNIADYVNNRMKTLEHMNRVYQIDVELGGECKDLVQPHRRWIAEGEVVRVKYGLIRTITTNAKIYLFNDILVMAEKTMSSYRFKCKADLLDTFIVDEPDDKVKNSFKLVTVNLNLQLSCKSLEDKHYWMMEIEKAIENLIENKNADSRNEYKDQRASLAGSLRVDLSTSSVIRANNTDSMNPKLTSEFRAAKSEADVAKVKNQNFIDLEHAGKLADPTKIPGSGFIIPTSALKKFRTDDSEEEDEESVSEGEIMNQFMKPELPEEEEEEKHVELESRQQKKRSTLFSKPPLEEESKLTPATVSINNIEPQQRNPYAAVSRTANPEKQKLISKGPPRDTRDSEDSSTCGCVLL